MSYFKQEVGAVRNVLLKPVNGRGDWCKGSRMCKLLVRKTAPFPPGLDQMLLLQILFSYLANSLPVEDLQL
jgi:hypothetical protein